MVQSTHFVNDNFLSIWHVKPLLRGRPGARLNYFRRNKIATFHIITFYSKKASMKGHLVIPSVCHLIALFIALFFLFVPTSSLYAAGETVVTTTSLADDGTDGQCSLREALQAAFTQKTEGKASVTYHECKVFAGPTTITFAGDAAGGVLTLKPTDALLPMIIKEVIIIGPVTIRGSGPQPANADHQDTRLFWVEGDGVLTLMNLTLQNAYTTGAGSAIFSIKSSTTINLIGVSVVDNTALNNGGAISTAGVLNITLSNFAGNKALGQPPDAPIPANGSGGAIAIESSGVLTVTRTNFSGNVAVNGGGAIYSKGRFSVADTVFNGNIAQSKSDYQGGGAIYNANTGTFALGGVVFNGNLAFKGGGGALYNAFSATGVISQTAFNGNISGDLSTAGRGGGLYNEGDLIVTQATFNANIATGDGRGGAILNNRKATLQLTNSNFFANLTPDGKGGALANTNDPNPVSFEATIEARNVTISGNSAQSGGAIYNEKVVALWNSIIEEGTTGTGGTCAGPQAVTDNGHNIQNPGTACGATMTSTDPKLDVPKPNPSLTLLVTQSPKDDSPVIDAGDNAVCSAPPVNNQDQGGGSRDKDGNNDGFANCDIGAVEAGRGLPGFGADPAQPGPIDFGNATLNTALDTTIMVKETGKLPLAIATATIDGPHMADFQVLTAMPLVIPNNAPPQALQLRCQPSAVGERRATLTLVTDDPFNLKVDYDLICRGTAVAAAGFASDPLKPGPVDFGAITFDPAQAPGSVEIVQELQLYEVGNSALQVNFQSISGDNGSDFAVVSGLPAQVDDGNSAGVKVTLRCRPAALGIRTAQLHLTTNDAANPTVSFDLVCTATPPPPAALAQPGVSYSNIGGAIDVALSPDGKQLYAAAGNTLVQIKRETDSGQLTPTATYLDSFLGGARSVAVSPDGAQVYVAAKTGGVFAIYNRNTSSGLLSLKDKYTNNQLIQGLTGAYGLAVAPNGQHIYVTGNGANAISIFSRDADNFVGPAADVISASDLGGARGLAVSPDGAHLYVAGSTASDNGTVAAYSRNPATGALTHIQTRREGEVFGVLPFIFILDGLAGASGVAISPDGQFVYVTAFDDDAVNLFQRDALTGKLSRLRLYRNGFSGVQGLDGASDLAFSQDSSKLFVSGYNDKAVAVFDRNPTTGLLTFVEAVVRDGNSGEPKLDGASGIAVSPVGAGVYVAAAKDNAIVAFSPANPRATLEALLPASTPAGSADLTMVIKGKNFVAGVQAYWNDSARPTTFVSAHEAKVTILAADLAAAGDGVLKVINPAPGGGESYNTATFTITPPGENPVPAVEYINPQSVPADVQQFTLHVHGSGFVPRAIIRLNGVDQPTTFQSSTDLEAIIGAQSVQTAWAAQIAAESEVSAAANQPAGVTVVNPVPGGGASNTLLFTIMEAGNNPTPGLTSLQPASVVAQGAAAAPLVVTIGGSNFMEGTLAYWNGSQRTVKFLDSGTLLVTLSGGDIALAGSGALYVTNPSPGGGQSNSLSFTIVEPPANPAPVLTAIQPDTLALQAMSSPPQTILVKGSNFLPSSEVYWNEVVRATTFVDSTTLQVTLTPTDTASVGQAQVMVINPPPGGGTSNALPLTVSEVKLLYLPLIARQE